MLLEEEEEEEERERATITNYVYLKICELLTRISKVQFKEKQNKNK